MRLIAGLGGRRGARAAMGMLGVLALAALPLAAAKPARPAAKAGASPAGYGTKVRFAKGVALHFPDLDLTFLGKRHETSDILPQGFDYWDFDVAQGEHVITVSWTPGTGDIGPQFFKRPGHEFALELMMSDWLSHKGGGRAAGRLAEDELVLWKDPKY